MDKFEILCVTMNRKDFSFVDKMNVKSNIVVANQSNETKYEEFIRNERSFKMITTNTHGVGLNRNICSSYATGDICLFSDDDVIYNDDVESVVLEEFKRIPNADVIIFNFKSDTPERQLRKYNKVKKVFWFSRKPWATFQIAFRKSSIQKANIHFTTLFGGGCIYPCGEDTQWIRDALKNNLKIYVSDKTIGTVSFAVSTWFDGYNKAYYYGQGAAYEAHCKKMFYPWILYTLFRTRNESELRMRDALRWMLNGAKGYKKLLSYSEFCKEM